jgi:hypothetical protein
VWAGSESRAFAEAILAALVRGCAPSAPGLEHAIQVELLISALGDVTGPRSVSDLLKVLDRISVGVVAQGLVAMVRRQAEAQPHLQLVELAEQAP